MKRKDSYRRILDIIPDPIFEVDENLIITLANKEAQKRWPTILEGKSLYFEIITQKKDKPENCVIENTFKLKKRQSVEITSKRGEIFEVNTNYVEERDAKRVVAHVQEISGQRKMAAALAYEQYLLHTIMDNVLDCIYFKDTRSRFIRVSKKMAEYFGVDDPAQMLGKTDFDFFSEEHARPAYEDEQEVIRSGQAIVREEKETWLNGHETWASTVKLPMRSENGKIIGTFGISREITDRKRAEEEMRRARETAEEANRAKSEFLANMSHEIRTPLNGIVGMIHLLLDTSLSPVQREYAEMAIKSADLLLGIINDILDLSKIEAGKLELESVDFDLLSVLEDICDILGLKAQGKGLKMIHQIAPAVPSSLCGAPVRLRQILTNLLANAIKFTNEGEVSVQIKVDHETEDQVILRFIVKDTGIGIPEDRMDSLFRAFTQAEGSYNRKYGGTGLGLAISKQLVELMGGQIGVQSTPGRGSIFWFSVPLQKQPLQESARAVQEPGRSHAEPSYQITAELKEKTRILLVEDNIINQKLAHHILVKLGYQVDAVGNGLDALKALESLRYDLVLMDIQMPEMDGLETSRCIRSSTRWATSPHVPIIAITAHAIKGDREKCMEAGMNDYISKPFDPIELSDIIARWLFRGKVNK